MGFSLIVILYEYLYDEITSLVQDSKYVHPEVYAKYKEQQPELTIIKGSGPFAIAHHRGSQPQAAYEPIVNTSKIKPQEVDQARADKQLAKFISSHNTYKTINYHNSTHNGDNIGDNSRKITVTNGNYVEGNQTNHNITQIIQKDKKSETALQIKLAQLEKALTELEKFQGFANEKVDRAVSDLIALIQAIRSGTQTTLKPDTTEYLAIAQEVRGYSPELSNAIRNAAEQLTNYP